MRAQQGDIAADAPLTMLLKRLEDASAGGQPVTDAEIRTFIEMKPGLPQKIEAILRDYLAGRLEKRHGVELGKKHNEASREA